MADDTPTGWKAYTVHLIVAASVVFFLVVSTGSERMNATVVFVNYIVMMADPIVLAVTILAGIFIRPAWIMIAATLVAGLALGIFIGAVNPGYNPPPAIWIIRILSVLSLATATHAIATAVRLHKAETRRWTARP